MGSDLAGPGCHVATVGQLLCHPGPGLTQPSTLKWLVNRVPACLVGVKAALGGVCLLVSDGR